RMRIPLSGGKPVQALASLSHQQRRMLDGIERDTDIVTGRSKRENVEDALTGTDFERVAYATTEVTTTSTVAGDNSLIILNGTVTGSQEVQANQTLLGGGKTINIRGRHSGLVVPFTAPGAAGSLETPSLNSENLALSGSNIHVSGITIVGDRGGAGDQGKGLSMGSGHKNIYLTNLHISKTWDYGISGEDDNEVTISNVTLTEIDADAIVFGDSNTIAIHGTTIDNSFGGGIDIRRNNVEVVISDTRITNIQGVGIDFSTDNEKIVVSNTLINDTGGKDAFQFSSGNTDVTISNVTIRGDVEDAIELGGGGNAKIWALEVTGSERGIAVGRAAKAEIRNSTFTDITGKVFDSGNEVTWTLLNSTVNGAGDDVFELGTDDKLYVAGNTFLGDIAGSIFSFERDGAVVQDGSTGNYISGVTFTSGGQVCSVSSGVTFSGSTIKFLDVTTTVDPPIC
ncbi:MAG: right-handed parallel beta-helix repeat-containing protein, partial [Pseudomonadota bacterium]